MNHRSENRTEKLRKEVDNTENYLNNEYSDEDYSDIEVIVKSIGNDLLLVDIIPPYPREGDSFLKKNFRKYYPPSPPYRLTKKYI